MVIEDSWPHSQPKVFKNKSILPPETTSLVELSSRKEEEYALYVHLTPKGWDRQQLVRHTLERLESAVLKGLDPEEVAAMKDGLAEVCLLLSEGGEDLQ